MDPASAVVNVVTWLPQPMVEFAGIIVAVWYWRRSPRRSALAVVAFGCLLLSYFISLVQRFLPTPTYGQPGLVLLGSGSAILVVVLWTVALVLLIWALFFTDTTGAGTSSSTGVSAPTVAPPPGFSTNDSSANDYAANDSSAMPAAPTPPSTLAPDQPSPWAAPPSDVPPGERNPPDQPPPGRDRQT